MRRLSPKRVLRRFNALSLRTKFGLWAGSVAVLFAALGAEAWSHSRDGVYLASLLTATGLGLIGFFLWLHCNVGARLARMNAVLKEMEARDDFSVRLPVSCRDELGHLAENWNNLAEKTRRTLERERLEKEDLDEMVELIHGVVEAAARGDLTRFLMEFHGDQRIDHLANAVRTMIANLNELATNVREAGFQVAQSTSEIAASSSEQETTGTQLAATSHQISASATEIAANSKELVSRMDQVGGVLQEASDAAVAGHHGLRSMDESIQAMVNAVETISAKLETLREKAANINVVVSTITKVADQTNLLSLNAAIEAEKAGEYGRGFSVVATEIRRLADQTAVSTWDIEQMVKEIQSSTSACVMAMEKVSGEIYKGADNVQGVSQQLTEIIDKVKDLLPGFASVQETIHSQSDAAGQISESIRQMNQSAQETADSLHRSSAAVRRLKDAVEVLNGSVARFTIE